MFRKVLIANRGEIAGRIVTTLRRMGVQSVVTWSDADATTLPVRMADQSVRIGAAPPASSYLDATAIVEAALKVEADAVHPGYGFLAERAEFAEQVEAAGLVFIGPTPEQLRAFGAKHLARALAQQAAVPLLAASDLVADADEALAAAADIGYPVVLKATAGGGGIGMRVCRDPGELAAAYDGAYRQAAAAFGDGRVYVERYLEAARHVEVQVVGDGTGRVVTLGDRDCSMQRRNQKIVEEAPAPNLAPEMRTALADAAQRLAASVGYRSTGTVEFLVEPASGTVAFLEVNARLQVEHTVTETIHGIDLVEWMVRIAAGDTSVLDRVPPARGHAIEARLCAENPWRGLEPSAGVLSGVSFPSGVRVDTWVETGTEVTTHYDSLLAKVVGAGMDREGAVAALADGLAGTRLDGLATNLGLVQAVLADPRFREGAVSTALLGDIAPQGRVIEVTAGGMQTTVQDVPGRLGLWGIGVPPSGAMDDLSFRLGNRALGNPDGAPGLELAASGPHLRFHAAATICLTGAPSAATLDGEPLPMWVPVEVLAGGEVAVGAVGPPGIRAYLLVAGGIEVPEVLGSAATFPLGRFGGHAGRALRPGDIVTIGRAAPGDAQSVIPVAMTDRWELAVLEGPHAGTEFLTDDDLDVFYRAEWKVHHNSDRTGVRLLGPKPAWARADGGEAGLHPSNIHDTAYAVGAVDFTGDMPILLGPDGPSLGGFVCPATVAVGDRWKLGQLRPDDTVHFVPVPLEDADSRRHATKAGVPPRAAQARRDSERGLIDRWEADDDRPAVAWRRAGEDYVLVEYGPMVLDLALRFRVHALYEVLRDQAVAGIVDLTPGIRSLQIHTDPDRLPSGRLVSLLQEIEPELPSVADAEVSSRIVHLPLSWDDPATREAIHRYMSTVRADAPWCPWNIEFIRRINGLDDVADVQRIVYDASYLVLGLGDVYLGAPVATPLDPAHRLVTTKYNPARTWTPENAVGIGGAYLCVYGMEGPGGYQFVGRTVPVWNRFHRTKEFTEPWLLRFFDQLRFFDVGADELLDWRRDLLVGQAELQIEEATLRLADHLEISPEAAAFRARQQQAFSEERARWAAAPPPEIVPEPAMAGPPPGSTVIEAALLASVWKVLVEVGEEVRAGDPLVVLESMKMETSVLAPDAGRVSRVLVRPGQDVVPGQALIALGGGS